MIKPAILSILVAGVFLLLNCTGVQSSGDSLEFEKAISMPGVSGRIDHLAINFKKEVIYLAALGNNTVEVIDLQQNKVVYSIKNLQEPQGIIFIPKSNVIFVANGDNGECDVFDADSFHKIASVKLEADADNVRYDADEDRIYVGCGEGGIAIINGSNYQLISEIKLSGHPESFQLDKQAKKIYVNVPDAHLIEVIDLDKGAVISQWKMTEAKSNFPMAFDEINHRLFIGCRHPSKILVLDSQSGKIIATPDIDGDVDDIFYDNKSKRIFLSCGEGYVDIIKQESADKYTVQGKTSTHSGARTSLFVAEQKKLLIAAPSGIGSQARLLIYSVK